MLTRAYPPKGGGAKPPVLGSRFQDSGAAGRADPTRKGPSPQTQHPRTRTGGFRRHIASLREHCVVGYIDSLRRVALVCRWGQTDVSMRPRAVASGVVRVMPLTELRRAFTPFFVFLSILVCVNPCVASAANTAPTISGSPPDHGRGRASRTTSNRPPKTPTAIRSSSRSSTSRAGSASSSRPARCPARRRAATSAVFPGIKIWVSDGIADRSLDIFAITVTAAANSTSGNTAPKISGTPSTSAVVNQSYAFQPTASDANGDKLTFTIKNKPGWAAFSSSTGRLSGTPSSSSTGIVREHRDHRERRQSLVVAAGVHDQRGERREGRRRDAVVDAHRRATPMAPCSRISRAIASTTVRRPGSTRARCRCRVRR